MALSTKHMITYLRAMYLYNISIMAESDVGEAVRMYLNKELAYDENGTSLSLLEMLDSPHEGVTYCIQLCTENREEIASFQTRRFAAIRAQLETAYAGKVLFFDSIMKYLNQ
ncbi:hypothetical protein GCM10011386_36980 [Parapedobacter defluvii]|uniref:DUF4286 family protein n=1 Tax=Parapedobacter defluvii TaxID=2045106 RepID=A0ABQ1MR19_9SPHI|nr:DUF4286 family protein [Parapedobacter defluvii]RQP09260.1 MAG: DUF4286 family protein [Parapedobacter sp.]GGC41474.1 hypothetical protein GCM10011386_36980 [Parapedobacter defluvii]